MPKIKAQNQTDQSTGKSDDLENEIISRYAISLPIKTRQLAKILGKKEKRSFSNLIDFLICDYAKKSGIKSDD